MSSTGFSLPPQRLGLIIQSLKYTALKMAKIVAVALTLAATLLAQDPQALSESAQRAAQAQRYEEAERLWRKAIDISPRYFPALFNLGLFFFSRKQFNDAVPLLERAADASPQDFNTHYLRACLKTHLGSSRLSIRAIMAM